MPTVRLTDRLVKNLKTKKKQEDFWDETFPGTFGVRVTDRGSKTFILRYRFGGRRRRLTLGRYQVLSLATARKVALEQLGETNKGEDPAEKRRQENNAGTFEELAQSYLDLHARPNKKPASIKEDTRILDTYLLPAWGRRKFLSITRSDVIGLLDEVKFKRGAPVMANRVKALASTIFNFAARKALVPETFANPCTNVEQPTKETSRDRVLSDDEINLLWEDLEDRGEPTASIYRLVLLTGQRPGEVKAMRWQDIDSENIRLSKADALGSLIEKLLSPDIWTIPPTETKNRREHKVPLSSHALAVLEQLRPLTGDGEFIFAAPGGGHIKWLQKMSQRIQKNTGFNFRPHDLRRTCAINLSKLGSDDVTIATILNHSWPLRHMTAVYNRWERLPEMSRALERWGFQVSYFR